MLQHYHGGPTAELEAAVVRLMEIAALDIQTFIELRHSQSRQQLDMATSQLKRTEQRLKDLTASIPATSWHRRLQALVPELATPINVVQGRAFYLYRFSDETRLRSGLTQIAEQAERMTAIMRELGVLAQVAVPESGEGRRLHENGSASGNGSAGTLDSLLPIVVDESSQSAAPVAAPLILIVDDEAVVGQLLAEMIRLCITGTRVETTISSSAALQRLTSSAHYDVVISDVNMPGLDGVTLLTHIKAVRPEVPVVMMSGGMRTTMFCRTAPLPLCRNPSIEL